MTRKTLPEKGREWPELEAMMADMAKADVNWRAGRVPLYVFHAKDSVADINKRAFMTYFTENALGAGRAFHSVKRMEDDILDFALNLFHAPETAAGSMTTGGSESIFLAMKACRDWTRANRPGVTKPNVVASYSVHLAFEKAAHVMDIEMRRTPQADDFRADPKAMEAAIDDQTMMIVGSAPSFPQGVIDPIAELGELAQRHNNLWLHVDACVGGYFAPFARMAGYDIPDFDFAVPGVTSMSADLHKFGYTAKPASTVFYRDADKHQHQYFDFDNWPSGRMVTYGVTGTRPAGGVAAAWAVMHHLGVEGYVETARQVLELAREYREGISAIQGLRVYGKPHLSIVNYGSDTIDNGAIADAMTARDWLIGRTKEPMGMHLMLSNLHEQSKEAYLTDLAAAVEEVRGRNAPASSTEVAYA